MADKAGQLTIINKSKFYAFAHSISTPIQANEILMRYKKEFGDATHICYAYICNSPNAEKCSDDGEPKGTAGRPLLQLLKKRKKSEIIVIVVRYFGGKKLGAGGLIRAYINAGVSALDNFDSQPDQ